MAYYASTVYQHSAFCLHVANLLKTPYPGKRQETIPSSYPYLWKPRQCRSRTVYCSHLSVWESRVFCSTHGDKERVDESRMFLRSTHIRGGWYTFPCYDEVELVEVSDNHATCGCLYSMNERTVKACSNGPNNVGPRLFNKLQTLGSIACFSNVLIIL